MRLVCAGGLGTVEQQPHAQAKILERCSAYGLLSGRAIHLRSRSCQILAGGESVDVQEFAVGSIPLQSRNLKAKTGTADDGQSLGTHPLPCLPLLRRGIALLRR